MQPIRQYVYKSLNITIKLSSLVFLILIYQSLNNPLTTLELGSPNQSEGEPFTWENYKNPEMPEFWDKGGDGTAPRPFRHYSAYPTNENLIELVEWQKIQQKASLERFVKIYSFEESRREDTEKEQTIKFAPPKNIAWKKLHVIYIYSSVCMACKQNQAFIKELKEFNVEITFLQTDDGKPLYDNSLKYTDDFKTLFPSSVTPTLYFNYQNNTGKLEGAATMNQFISALNKENGES